jgi:aryl-alcohol dehydrogenase-like predicted oxidoreductase
VARLGSGRFEIGALCASGRPSSKSERRSCIRLPSEDVENTHRDVFFQIPYSAIEREHEAAIAVAAAAGAGIVILGGAAKGAPAQDKQTGMQWERWRRAGLDDLLQGMTPVEFVLRFTFSHPDMDTTIVGTVNPAHLDANLAALRAGPLASDLYAEAKRRLTATGFAPQPSGSGSRSSRR